MIGTRIKGKVKPMWRHVVAVYQRLRPRLPLERRVERSLKQGVGMYRQTWRLDGGPIDAETLPALSSRVDAWVEEAMSRTRRPYGVDQMAFAIACGPAVGEPIKRATFAAFRPSDFYGAGGIKEQIDAFIGELSVDEINRQAPHAQLAAALFSWGDLARATVFAD
ncbi:MAG TPA: hypothetical protein QGF05_11595 [Dehalococcoidia bacterium]|nr:hypothetical protein [Dehalococcoidia bacterium]